MDISGFIGCHITVPEMLSMTLSGNGKATWLDLLHLSSKPFLILYSFYVLLVQYVYNSSMEHICVFFILFLYIVISNKVGDHSRGRPEGSLFNSYYTEV